MKQLWMIGAICLLLAGCAGQETMETISDDIVTPVLAQPRKITLELPEDAVAPVLESDSEQLYFTEEYQIAVETLSGGDLDATVRAMSGCDREKLTIMETTRDGITRYDFVWAAAGENGDLLGQGAVLDDGTYHYCLAVLRPAETTQTSQISWRDVFSSFGLEEGAAI